MEEIFCTYLAEFVAFQAAYCGQYPSSESDRVIYKHTEAALGEWMNRINDQRRALDAGHDSDLSLQQVEMLNQVGFLWDLRYDEKWDDNYNKLCEYYEQEGHSNVPFRNGSLGRWVGAQRTTAQNVLEEDEQLRCGWSGEPRVMKSWLRTEHRARKPPNHRMNKFKTKSHT